MQESLHHWLSLRVRVVCIVVLLLGALFPPYVPSEGQGMAQEDMTEEAPQLLLVEDGFLMKSSSLTQQGARRAYAQGIVHTVRAGDSLEKIATLYGIKAETILWANKLTEDTTLRPGQELLILPVDGVLHTVTRGQTLSRIADLYTVPSKEIAQQNHLEGDFIVAGQELIIPGGRPIVGRPQVALKQPISPFGKPGQNLPAPTGKILSVPQTKAEPSLGVLQMPCNGCRFTQFFRPGHYAVDIQTKGGGPIFAAEDGVVTRADYGWEGGYGNVVEIDHGNGLITLYAHNKELYVRSGDTVRRGQVISWMGNTGRVYGDTGIHVHFEVRVNGEKKNPLLYLK